MNWITRLLRPGAKTYIILAMFNEFRRPFDAFPGNPHKTLHSFALKRLSDWMVAWRFRESSPKHQIRSGNQQQLRVFQMESGKTIVPGERRETSRLQNRFFGPKSKRILHKNTYFSLCKAFQSVKSSTECLQNVLDHQQNFCFSWIFILFLKSRLKL